ncbi:MAG: hypothetical protein VX672_00965, partial [Planctomycetota bacterium]|nr:hypothetical protein [Planctomycetota bacterium]
MTAERIETQVDRLLGCGRAAGPRRTLGLGEAPVDPATLEAAFTMRCRLVEAASVEDAVKVAARQRLDAAVAVLRIGVAAPSPVRPVRPVDPSLLEQRRVPPRRPTRPGSMVPPPEGPIAGRRRPVRPEPRITAAHLTPFDRMVLSVLVAGGGWNGRTRVLVAGLAHQAGVDAATLKRVVVGLARFMRQEGVSGTLDEMSRTERLPAGGLVAPGPLESAVQRVADGVGREFRGETVASRTRVASLFVLLALAFVGLIVVLITAPSPEVRAIEERRLVDAEARALAAERSAAEDPGHVVTPSVREGVVRPVEWSRPPMFGVERAPEASVLKIDGLPVLEDDLLGLARDLELDPDRVSEARVAQWDHAVGTFSEVWPLLEPGRRTILIESVLAVLRQADAEGTSRRLMGSLQVDPTGETTDPLDSWRRAFRAGILGAIVLDESMPDPVRQTARMLVRTHLPGSNGRHSRGGPFAALAGRALDTMVEPMVGQFDTVEQPIVHESWEWWLRAQEAIRVSTELQQAHLRAIGGILVDGRGLAGDGAGADVLGRLVHEVDWSAAGPDPLSVREAYQDWFGDATIPSESTWVLGSLLDGPRGIGWYRPDFIPDPDLGLDGRSAALARALSAWPEALVTAAAGEVVAVAPEILATLDSLVPRLRNRIGDARTPIERLDALLAAERLALATALVVDDREREARAVVDRVRAQLDRGESGVDLDPATTPRRKSLDGEWARRLQEAGRVQEEAVAVIESLRSDALAGDLGPIDAAALVDEVWKGRQRV